MIQLIYGAKGSGKTKKIIDAANLAAQSSKGDIVFITDTDRYTSEIKYTIRFTNTEKNGIVNEDGLIGFIKGLIAGNYDIKEMYIDGAARICRKAVEQLESVLNRLEEVSNGADVKFVLSVSAAEEELPQFMKKYI